MKSKLYIVMAILLAVSVIAINYYENVPISYLSVNQTECEQVMDKVPRTYFKGLSSIIWYETPYTPTRYETSRSKAITSLYFYFSHKILIRSGCDLEAFVHELAHHQQSLNGIPLWQARKHDDTFTKEQQEIVNLLY